MLRLLEGGDAHTQSTVLGYALRDAVVYSIRINLPHDRVSALLHISPQTVTRIWSGMGIFRTKDTTDAKEVNDSQLRDLGGRCASAFMAGCLTMSARAC